MSAHVLADGSGAIECPRDSGRWCRLCELLDPGHPDHDPRFRAIYLGGWEPTPVQSSHNPPSLAESLARIAAMKACPHWRASSDCGCGNNRCALGKGRAGVVSHRDCGECLGLA